LLFELVWVFEKLDSLANLSLVGLNALTAEVQAGKMVVELLQVVVDILEHGEHQGVIEVDVGFELFSQVS